MPLNVTTLPIVQAALLKTILMVNLIYHANPCFKIASTVIEEKYH
ncbi:hypothetical protein ACTHO5_12755 [Cytobacillus praedii]